MNSPNDNVHSVNILVDQNKDLINSCGHKGGNGVHLNTKSTKPLITNDDLKCTPVLNKCFKCSKQSSNCDECVGKTESCNISPSDCSVKVPSCCDNQDLILQTNQPHSYEQCCPAECLSGDKLACELKSLNFSDEVDTLNPTFARDSDTSEHIVSAINGICYARYSSELQMPAIMHLITKDLSEPYSIYTYRYFIHNWPQLCYLAIHRSQYVGAIVCKLDLHKKVIRRGYIAMLAVDESVRRKKIGSNLVKMAIEAMVEVGCDEVVLETEVTNQSALNLYENLGFVRDKRLFRYYLNGVDALRLKLWLC